MRVITIGRTRQYQTLVSDEDYDYLQQWLWTYAISHKHGHLVYARRSINIAGSNVTILMHHVVLERAGKYPPTDRHTCHHVDCYSLNNQRHNLVWATHKQQMRNRNPVYPFSFTRHLSPEAYDEPPF